MRRVLLFFPLALFLLLALFLFKGLFLNKEELPSALMDRPFPAFNLPTVKNPEERRSHQDLLGNIALVNVWATWCATCRAEHQYLLSLAEQEQIAIFGVNYKDDQADARRWLVELHDPYLWSVNDIDGRLGLDLGVYGAPETYLIDAQGVIRYKHVGELEPGVWAKEFMPRIEKLRGSFASGADLNDSKLSVQGDAQ